MSNRLNSIRSEKGLALRGLTARTGVSTSTLSAIEKWDYQPAPATREKIAKALEVQVSDIWPTPD